MEDYNIGIARSDEQIARLLSQRPPGWEYLLYSGALCAGVERLDTKYMDYCLGYAPRLGLMVNKSDFLYFIESQLGELRVMIDNLNTLISGKVWEDALGPPGVAGNPDEILHAASRVVRLYEDMLLWAERVRGMAMPSEYREVTELLVRFAGQPINELRNFVQRFGAQFDDLPSRFTRGEKISITETITFSIPHEIVESFDTKLERLMSK